MVGIPDGLGGFRSAHGDFTLLMNHELTATAGIARAHGTNGAFVSRWTINARTLKVTKGQDLTPSADDVLIWNPGDRAVRPGHHRWERLCSADLAAEGAFSPTASAPRSAST